MNGHGERLTDRMILPAAMAAVLLVFGCAANFTAIGSGDSYLQDRTILNQLITSYREHQLVLSNTPLATLVAEGDNVQLASLFSNIQVFCLANWGSFVNHTFTSPTGVTTLGGVTWYSNSLGSAYNSQAEYLRAAGLTNGPRRASTWDPAVNNWQNYADAMFTYGLNRAGEYQGPWLVVDCQKLLSALKWTRKRENSPMAPTLNSTNEYKSWRANSGTANIYWNLEYGQCVANWASHSFVYGSDGGAAFLYRANRRYSSNEAAKVVSCTQARSQAKVRTQSDVAPLAVASNMTYTLETYFIDKATTNASKRFVDMDGLGFELNQWELVDSQGGVSAVRPYMSAWYGNDSTMPFDLGSGVGAWSQVWPSPPRDLEERIECDWVLWVIKWDWSYCN